MNEEHPIGVFRGIARSLRRSARGATKTPKFLYTQRFIGFDIADEPHFDPETTELFTSLLTKADRYLEFGAGGSTLLADRLGIPTRSVESDRYFAKAVRERLRPGSVVDLRTPGLGFTKEWGWPIFHAEKKGGRYVAAGVENWDVGFADLILVDGRYRAACALAAARAAHACGCEASLLFDDYRQRPHYHLVERWIGEPQQTQGRSALFSIGNMPVPREAVASCLDHVE